MDQINGNHRAFENMQQQAQQAFGEFVKAFLNEALHSGRFLQPGYKGTVIFSNRTNPHGDVILSNASLDDVFYTLRSRMAAAGLATPAPHTGAATAPKQDEGDLHLRLVNMVAAIRRAMMFMDGPGADTAKALLRKALLEPANEQQAHDVVAGYLSTMPAFANSHPEEAVLFLDKLANGANVVTMSNTADVVTMSNTADVRRAPPEDGEPRGSSVWNDTKQQWEPES